MHIVVTGSSSYLARALLPILCEHPRISAITGIDVNPPHFSHPRFKTTCLDIRAPEIAQQFAGIDAVVHLAFVVMQGTLKERRNDRALMRNINIDGSVNVFRCAARAGVKNFIHLSSAAVYALPSASSKITESHQQAPLAEFAYAEDKIALERWLNDWEAQHRELRIVRLRPHVILGPHAQPFIKAFLRLPFYPQLPQPLPHTQCVHEQDITQAIMLALFSHERGAFNLAGTEAFTLFDMQKMAHRHPLPLPFSVIRKFATVNWRWFGVGTHPAWVEGLRYSLVLDSTRALTKLGWQPRYASARDCLISMKT